MTQPTQTAAPIVTLSGVGKMFGPVTALESVDLEVRAGEILTLLGPSGCGKTTLMRLVAGFEQPTTGRIVIDGQDVTGQPPERRPVNMVFQRYALFPHLDVFDNVAFGLRLKRLPREQIRERVMRFLEVVQLADYSHRWTSELSGGQAQRVALARALANEPAVLLLDEPLAALDLKIRQQMLVELKRIHNETGTTFIYVTHDQDEAMILSDRIVLMNKGSLVQIDEPERIYAQPRNLFAAKFLGDTNIIEGEVRKADGGGAEIVCPLGAFPHSGAGGMADGPITISLRPESINLVNAVEANGAGAAVGGKVDDVTYIGSRVIYDVRTEAGVHLRIQEPRPVSGLRFHRGDAVGLTWSDASMLLLTE